MEVAEKLNIILKQNEKNKLSHAFLIETNNIDKCLDDIKKIIININTNIDYDEKYLTKLIELNNLPSLIIIEPDGLFIKKGQLEELEKKFSTKPIYSKYNNYIIVQADKMNDSSSNAILKFLEEPEENIIGFLIVNNKENVLPTIKSRCEIIHVDYDTKIEYDENIKKDVDNYLDKIYNTSDYLINKNDILAKYTSREEIEVIFKIMFEKYHELYINSFDNDKNNKKYKNILSIIQDKLKKLSSNVNIELLLDNFVIEMRRVK